MTRDYVLDLLWRTLFQPRDAARIIIGMRLPSQTLWMALVLMSILNTIVYTLSLQLSPSSGGESTALMPAAFQTPVIFAAFLFGALALTVIALYYVGQGLGGSATMADILALMTWLQVLRLLVQAAVLVLALGVPAVGAILVIVSAVWGAYILINFVDAAHRFDNRFKSAGVIVLSFVAMAVGLSTLLSLAGLVML